VLWVLFALGLTGLFLGLRCRAPAMIAASSVTCVGHVIIAPLTAWPPLSDTATGVASLTALQTGYLIGVAVACAMRPWWRRIAHHASPRANLAL
jgi:hypothetical protein